MTSLDNIDLLKSLPSVSRKYLKIIDQNLAPYQLSSSLYYYITKLHDFGDLPQDKLVQLTGLSASNVTRAIQKLIALDYIKKAENPEDRRGFLLSLTNKGEDIYPVIKQALHSVHNQFLMPLTLLEKEHFIKIINKL